LLGFLKEDCSNGRIALKDKKEKGGDLYG